MVFVLQTVSLALPPQTRSTSFPSQLHSTFLPCQTISTILFTETLSIRIALSPFLPHQTLATSLAPPETRSSNPNFLLFLFFCAPISLTPPQMLSIALW
ncbi:hypothetical protein DEO72_LG2g3598 [Vigna unguiculata]|uniref:Uncharacterized protein n=1 Tax=Vigna unguiculata TaxID=3917 RepID=A0A4D6L475_VIGUN|nr:hypothetical protein DEO72_LG2g3598 [Vigna unguiculata]